MPTTRRSRRVAAPPAEVWRTVGDPHSLGRWWPKVQRVEQVSGGRFTQLLGTDRGRAIRADFRISALDRPEVIAWEQDVEGTPFERVLRSARTTVRLTPEGKDATTVDLTVEQKLTGFAAFGGLMVRRASRKQLDEALDALAGLHGAA